MRLVLLPLLCLLSATHVAHANPADVAPPDWQRSANGAMTVYRSANGKEAMLFREIADVTDPTLAVKMIADGLTQNSDRLITSSPSTEGVIAVHDIEYERRSITMVGKVIGVRQSNGTFLALAHVAPNSEPGLRNRLAASVQKMAALAGSSTGAAPRATAQQQTAQTPPQTSTLARGAPVSQVLFELSYKYGVGGAAYPNYELVALLRNGDAAKLGGYAVDAVDVAAIRRRKPADVGKWQAAGRNYRVRWQDGDTSELKPTVGPPRPLPGRNNLVGRYQAIGGGGNIALGGGTLTAQVKEFNFRSDGTFSHSSKKSASSGAGVGRSQSGSAGRWSLSGPTLTLTYRDGRTVRTSVFYSGSRKPGAKFGRYGVLWIGGDDYRRVR